MGLMTNTYQEATGSEQELGMAGNLGFGFMGGGIAEAIGMGRGKYYMKNNTHSLLGGGFQNRFVRAAGGGIASGFGFDTVSDEARDFLNRQTQISQLKTQGKLLRPNTSRAVGQLSKIKNTSAPAWTFMGYHNVKAAAMQHGVMSKAFAGKAAGALLGPTLSLGFLGYSMYSGYQQGGIMGMYKEGAMGIASMAAMEVGSVAFKRSFPRIAMFAKAAMPTIAAGVIAWGAASYGQEYQRGLKKMEMVHPVIDPHGTGFTMRQRSINAIQKSYLNGRLALGNESQISYTPYLR
jgi:hypothetical protein